jgi:hypothetical protein
MPDQPKTVGQLLRYLRKKAGLTLSDVARVCNVSVVNISAAERHQRTPLQSCVDPQPTPAQVTASIALDRVLHPYGKCICHGKGTCEWHQGQCESCCGEGTEPGSNIPCHVCDGSGRKDAEGDWDRAEKRREDLEFQLHLKTP